MARNQYQPPQFKTSDAEPHAFRPPDLFCMLDDGYLAYRSQSLQTQKLIEIRALSAFVLLARLLSSRSKRAWKTIWCDMFSLRNDTFLQEDRGCLSESTHSRVHFLCTKGLSSFPLVSLYWYRYTLFMAGKFKAAIGRPSLDDSILCIFGALKIKDQGQTLVFFIKTQMQQWNDILPFLNMKGLS